MVVLLIAVAVASIVVSIVVSSAYGGTGAPVNVKPPKVSGTPRDGSKQTALHGSWYGSEPIAYAYQWLRCNSTGESCKAIANATGQYYWATHEDVGNTLRVTVTASNELGSASVTSPQSQIVAPLAPKKLTLPVLTGTLKDGQVLSTSNGAWKGTPPFTYTYQWQSCVEKVCVNIAEATGQSYRLRTADIGKHVRAVVSAHNAAGSGSAASKMTAKIAAGPPVSTAAPAISGVPVDGQTLSASTGEWGGTGPFSYAYQWRSCNVLGECADIPGATGSTYTAGPLDVANSLEVVVTASNALGSASATSTTDLIQALLPSNTSLPTISGLLQDGQTLSAAAGGWSGTEPISYGYQWQLCNSSGTSCGNIAEATGAALNLVSAEVGSTVRVVVTATNAAGSISAASEPSGVIAALLPSNTTLPSIAGLLQDGQVLSAASGSWSGTTPISYSYQWQLCNSSGSGCSNIAEATGATLKLLSADVGSTVRVVVTATNAAGSSSSTSAATGVIAALLPSNTSLPSVSGLLQDGQVLSAVSGSWSGTTPIAYGYQWQLCNSSGGSCGNIAEATGATLKLVSAEVGSTVRVIVTATNGAGSSSSTSAATGVIAALLPSNTEAPKVSGLLQVGQILSASTGSWSGSTPMSYGYQWQLCGALGGGCSSIAGATQSTYTLLLADVGLTLRVVVTATNVGGSTAANSPVTGLIQGLL